MIFWIIAGLMTLLTIGLTIYPVFGNRQTPASSLDYDREIYKARMAEIEEERSLGTINEDEYQYAIAEEGRRFLALAPAASGQKTERSKAAHNLTYLGLLFAAIVIPLVAIFGYYQWGSVNTPDQPLQARLSADPKGQPIEILLQRAENQLIRNPDDGRGWLIIAPVYMRVGRISDAVGAYRNAIRIQGPTPDLQTALGEALTMLAGGVVPEEANQLFQSASASNPESAKPIFFLGIALNQAGEYAKAVDIWNKLIEKSPSGSPWIGVARQQLQLARSNLGTKNPANPTAQDIEDASQLSKGDRQEFINSMVERLAGELQENPQNKPGWQRIIRSYTVLGRKSEALAAIGKAEQIFSADKDFLKELEKNKLALNN